MPISLWHTRRKWLLLISLLGIVNEYDDYEKLIQLKVSDNFVEMARETAKAVQNITALANQFPDLKANTQYGKFLEAISENETFISNKRERLITSKLKSIIVKLLKFQWYS